MLHWLMLLIAPACMLLPRSTVEIDGSLWGSHARLALARHAHDVPDTAPPMPYLGYRMSQSSMPEASIEAYVRPAFAAQMDQMRPAILEAAARHNNQALSGMSTTEFAEILALILYNEHNGWFEDEIEAVRMITPLYQHAQIVTNKRGVGSNFSVWPTNLRPSVALEILNQELPVPDPVTTITIPISVTGSTINPAEYTSQRHLFAAITREITQDELAVEYLAVNLERGVYRSYYEGVPVSWRTLAGWHNQGIVQPEQIRANPCSREYIYRTSAYLPLAHRFIHDAEE